MIINISRVQIGQYHDYDHVQYHDQLMVNTMIMMVIVNDHSLAKTVLVNILTAGS